MATLFVLLWVLMIYFEEYYYVFAVTNTLNSVRTTNVSSLLNYSACNYVDADFQYLLTNLTSSSGKVRIFLVGDSLIGQMCQDTKFCDRNKFGTLYTLKMNPMHTLQSDWIDFTMHRLSGAPRIEVYYFSQYGGYIHVFEKELFQTFHPTSSDVLIILFGAHSREPKMWPTFVRDGYEKLASPFPGRVFWLEPFPSHFQRGHWVQLLEDTTKHIDCFELNPERNATQFWKVEIVRNIVQESDRIKLIRSYDILAPMDRCHKEVQFLQKNGNRDCTHYNNIAYSHVWRAISLAMLAAE